MSNELMSQTRTLLDTLQNFPKNLIEITLEITPHKLLLRNYVDDASGKSSNIYKDKIQNNVAINTLLSMSVNTIVMCYSHGKYYT